MNNLLPLPVLLPLLAPVVTPALPAHVRTGWSTETWPETLMADALVLKPAPIAGPGRA